MTETDSALTILGQSIRTARRNLGISQEDLARKARLHRTYMSEVERGKRNLSFLALQKIAGALGSSVSELAKDVQAEVPAQTFSPTIGDSEETSFNTNNSNIETEKDIEYAKVADEAAR